MQVTDKLLKPLTEMKYLNAENVDRYRCIMRIFYENYEKLKYWLYQEEVYSQMIENEYFQDYKPEQCQQDLSALTEWKNLTAMQDTRKVHSLEEFKNKKYRYQMSEYSVEIERLVLRLENLYIEGSSLEPTLLERIRQGIGRFHEMAGEEPDKVFTWWNDLSGDFRRLNQNYQDYMRDLNSVKAEEMMKTREFLVFKDKLVEYLRSFIHGLQANVGVIEEQFRSIGKETRRSVLDKVVTYEMSIPRLETEVTKEQIAEKHYGIYESIYQWFVSRDGRENEAGQLFDETNEIIRRITRYAAQISEKNAAGANRREEYRHVAEIFLRCKTVEEAHKMSAMVFGLEKPFHMKALSERATDSTNSSVYEEEAAQVLLKPRTRNYRERMNRSSMSDYGEKKREMKQQMLQQIAQDREMLQSLEVNGQIRFDQLPVIEPRVREILLKWLSDALENGNRARTEEGRDYRIDLSRSAQKCIVKCTDGSFTMPKLSIVFEQQE